MSDFNNSLEQFKYGAEQGCEIKRIAVNSSTHTPARSTTLDISELSHEQRHAYIQFTKGENLFITGPGGTGKPD